ncbi:MAG: hypothetical protein QXN55_08665 [Candidatus Nitrosotenuis sp.]
MKAKIVGIGLVAALTIAVVAAIIFGGPIDISPKKESEFKNWNRSGPFAINKDEYKIGENIFIAVEGLMPSDVGNAVFVLPNGTTKYISIPFDGSQKSGFNQYFKPAISKARHICSVDDIIGNWVVVFQGTQYEPLKFKILNETVPSEQGNFQRVC